MVDMTDLDAVRAAVTPGTRLVHLETPDNPTNEKFQKGFIRFSAGLEEPEDIIDDLDQALKKIGL